MSTLQMYIAVFLFTISLCGYVFYPIVIYRRWRRLAQADTS